jgi:hypothetical protein
VDASLRAANRVSQTARVQPLQSACGSGAAPTGSFLPSLAPRGTAARRRREREICTSPTDLNSDALPGDRPSIRLQVEHVVYRWETSLLYHCFVRARLRLRQTANWTTRDSLPSESSEEIDRVTHAPQGTREDASREPREASDPERTPRPESSQHCPPALPLSIGTLGLKRPGNGFTATSSSGRNEVAEAAYVATREASGQAKSERRAGR